jgi:hypothetical protein
MKGKGEGNCGRIGLEGLEVAGFRFGFRFVHLACVLGRLAEQDG